jgi:Homeodomain-like domain
MHSSTPPEGWENDPIRPLSSKPNFRSLDAPGNSRIADPNQPKDPELFTTAQVVLEAISRIHDLPAECLCGARFQGLATERRYSIVCQEGDAHAPEVRTLCGFCYDKCGLPEPKPDEDHETKLVRFAHEGGSTQKQIAAMFGLSQPTVCRILKRIRLDK